MKKFKTNKLRLSAGISLAVSLLCCLTLGFTGIFGGFKKAEATAVGTPISLGTGGIFESAGVKTLFDSIISGATDYNSLKSGLQAKSTAKGEVTVTYSEMATKSYVSLGGLNWNVVAASLDQNGEVVVTLWLASQITTSTYSYSSFNVSQVSTYAPSEYGMSLVRTVLVGGNYATNATGGTTSGTQNATFSTFLGYYGNFIDSPYEVSGETGYQATQSCVAAYSSNLTNINYLLPNDAYTTISGTVNSSGGGWVNTNGQNIQNCTNYGQWKNDKIWLPSFTEVGQNTTNVGLWGINNNSVRVYSTRQTWLRSGSAGEPRTVAYLKTDSSTAFDGNTYSNSFNVQPALHLNLKTVADNCPDDLYDEETNNLRESSLADLYSKISGKQNATVADVKNLLTASNNYQYSASDIRTDNAVTEGKDIYVNFGGLRWTVTYVSKSKTGNLVATLWLESSYRNGVNDKPQYSTWVTANENFSNTYVSSVYGTSYIRSYMNGTPYYTNSSGAINTTGAQSAYWKSFQETYGKFIIEPLYMGWQETERTRSVNNYTAANDAWGKPTFVNWYTNGSVSNQQATQKVGYSAWAVDKLWLPSITETGGENSSADYTVSLWGLNNSQRQNGTSTNNNTSQNDNTWLRTARAANAQHGIAQYADGTGYYFERPTNAYYGLRPAIHLNISGDATDLWNDSEKGMEDFTLNALMENLTSATSNKETIATSYKDLDDLLKATSSGVLTSADINANNGGADLNVKFGGMHWDLTYLSRTRTGDIIATLWLDNSSDLQPWNNFTNNSAAINYPSNMYGSSYVRAYLNGTPYSTNGNTLTSGASVQSAKWKQFINDYGSFLATPSQVAWQENLTSLSYQLGQSVNTLNDCYGQPAILGYTAGLDWLNGTNGSTKKSGYTDWKNDKLWLPAFAETGGDSRVAMWELSTTQQKNNYNSSWLRTGRGVSTVDATLLDYAGNASYNTVTSSYAVRPAIHLNLARIKDIVTPVISSNADNLTYNGEAQEVINSIHSDLTRVSYEVQFAGFDGTNAGYYANASGNNLEDGGITVENGTMFAKYAGKYTVTFTLRQAATTSGSSNYTINKGADGWNIGDVWAGIDDDVKTGLNERVESVVICFEIKPITLEVEWSGNFNPTYDGQPHTVTATPDGDIVSGETVELTLTYGGVTPTNAGEYVATATLSDSNYILKYKDADGFDTLGYAATCPLKIEKATIQAVWTTATEFTYSGGEQGAQLTALTGLCDDNATNAALLLAAQDAVAYDKSPVHVGNYVASLSLEGLTGFDNYELSETGAEFEFEITPAEVTASYASEDGTFTREFDGKKLEVTADGFTTLATDDDAESIFVIKYKLASAEDKPENWSETAPVFGEYVAKAFDIADGDYTVTNSQTITITKRQINIIWSGDEKSVITTYNGNQLLTWLYDGLAHAPKAAVDKDDLAGVVDLDGNDVDDLKLQVTSTQRQLAGSWTTTVGLAANDFNKYFTLAHGSCDYRIAKLEISAVTWYEHGDFGGKELEDGALFQKTEVFGTYGPEVEAYGAGTLSGKDEEGNAKTVASRIKLSVIYNATFANEYWTVGSYTATAGVTVSSSNADFASGLDRVLDFTVTEQKIEVREINVVWGLTVDGVFVELTDDLVVPFTGSAPKLVAKADSATGANLPVNEGSLVADAGTHTAYIDLKDSATVIYKNFECAYEITPLKVKLAWVEEEWFYTGSEIKPTARIDTTYTPGGTDAQEYADILQGIADLKLNVITVTGATGAGKHTAIAAMSENFEIVDGSDKLEITIQKYRLDISKVVWSSEDENSEKYDEDMNLYFSWANNGKLHAPKAELTVTIGGENKQIKLTVNGATAATGTHYATALLDSLDVDNNNFILGRFETTEEGTVFVPCGAECKFVIVQFEVGDVYWVTGANEGADVSLNGTDVLTFTYNGRGQCPRAYYMDGEEKVWLEVWGEMTDAGEYVAHISENFAFTNEGSNKCAFVILPQELEVRWQYDAENSPITYNGRAQAPTVKLIDSEGKEITALTDGNGYSILKFTEAGEHVAEISFTNGNYTYKAGTNEKAFTIQKYKINVTFTSSNDQGYEMTNVWTYKATEQGPSVRNVTVYLVEGGAGIIFGENSEHRIIVTGRESDVGTYTAVAMLDGSVADNDNYELVNAQREYEIAAHKIVINWKDTGSEGNFTWTYSGSPVCPTATYQDWTGATQTATVMGGNSSAGTYTASVVLPANCEFKYEDGHQYSGTHEFTIKRASVTEIVWYTDDTYEHEIEGAVTSYVFDGEMHLPAAKIKSTGAELIVTGARKNAGEGYVATAALSDAGNYVLDEANANKTVKFNITPMPVLIKWIGNEGADDEFVWTYTGGFICPTAVLTVRDESDEEVIVTENGKTVYVTVSGGAVSAGNEYVAIAVDNLANYDFATARHKFEIKAKELEGFEWNAMGANVDDSEVAGGGYYKYTYTYNGKTQRPLLTLDSNAAGVKFGYRVNKYDGANIGDIAETVNAGLYLVTVYTTDGNYALPEGAETVIVEIEQRTAIVQWSAISADGVTDVPEAWFFDADNQAVKLAVTPTQDGVDAGADGKVILKFKATVSPENDNYDFTGDMSKDFTMVVTSSGDVTWDFENNKWIAVPAEPVTPPGGGETEGGETEGGDSGEETGGAEGGENGGETEGTEGGSGETVADTVEGTGGDGTEATALTAETSVEAVENRAIAADRQQLIAEDKKSLSTLLDEE